MDTPQVLVSEVGPRGGLQSMPRTMPTSAKCASIDALVAGVPKLAISVTASAIHMHDIRGLRPANCPAAIEVDVCTFDAPCAPEVR